MFYFEEKLPIEVRISRPNFRYYILLDRQLDGCKEGIEQASIYIRQAFMIHNQEFREIYMNLGASLLSDMEVLSSLIHQMHGEDDRYYDESNDDTPVFELIKTSKTVEKKTIAPQHVNNDLCASILHNVKFEEHRIQLYEKLLSYIKDEGASDVFFYLKENAQCALHTLNNLLLILNTNTEVKDFGLGDSHNAFDLDTSNYFDKPNPAFLNESDIEEFKNF